MKDPTNEYFFIDYEFAGWQPRAMDLSGYINECVIDNNCAAKKSGIGCFPLNAMERNEIQYLIERYLFHIYKHEKP